MKKLLGKLIVLASAALDAVGEKLIYTSCSAARLGYRLQGRVPQPSEFADGAVHQVFDEVSREAIAREVLQRNPFIRVAPIGQRLGKA